MTEATALRRVADAARAYMHAALGRPVAEAYVALARALDDLAEQPQGTTIGARAVDVESDRWVRYLVAACTRLRRIIDAEDRGVTASLTLWQDGSCQIEAWHSAGEDDSGHVVRVERMGQGADPDRAIADLEAQEWRQRTTICGRHECQERGRKLALSRGVVAAALALVRADDLYREEPAAAARWTTAVEAVVDAARRVTYG